MLEAAAGLLGGRGGRLGRNSVFCLKEHPRPPGRRPVHCTGQRGAVAAPQSVVFAHIIYQ